MGFLGKFEEEKSGNDILKNVEIEGKKALEEQSILQELTKAKLAELTIEIERAKKQNERQDIFLKDTQAVAKKNAIQLESMEEKEREFLKNIDTSFESKLESLEERDRAFLKALDESNIFDDVKNDLKSSMNLYKSNIEDIEKKHKNFTEEVIENLHEHYKEIIARMYLRELIFLVAVILLTIALIFTSFKIVSVKNDYENIHQDYAEILQKLEKK